MQRKIKMQTNMCTLCPRNCQINRSTQAGFCGAKTLKVAKVMKHFWEEPCISGTMGSGTVFFSHCNLKCIYCQNAQISHLGQGKPITVTSLANLFKQLETSGVHNINLVTPTHYADLIMQALDIYKPSIPIVYNTSGYESVQTIQKLANYIDIYLCDFKYYDSKLSAEYSGAPDYLQAVTTSLLQMQKNQPNNVFNKNGIMQKGLIVRHLVLPTHSGDSIKILDWAYHNLGKNTLFSLMSQYTPTHKALTHPVLKNKVKPLEYKRVITHFLNLGFINGYSQELNSSTCEFIPDFNQQNTEFTY